MNEQKHKSNHHKKQPRMNGAQFMRKDGEFFGSYIDDKGYPRISSGPCRGKRIHVLVAEALLGRELKDTEIVHHEDNNRLNPRWTNLKVINVKNHNAFTNLQYWFLKRYIWAPEEKAWEEFLKSEEAKQGPLLKEENWKLARLEGMNILEIETEEILERKRNLATLEGADLLSEITKEDNDIRSNGKQDEYGRDENSAIIPF